MKVFCPQVAQQFNKWILSVDTVHVPHSNKNIEVYTQDF